MDVLMKVLFKFVQLRKKRSVGIASSLWWGVTVAQFRNTLHHIACFIVLLLHHVDWILHASKMCFGNRGSFSFSFYQFFDKWEKDQFFLSLVGSHGLDHFGHQFLYFGQFGIMVSVDVVHTFCILQ